MINQKGLSGLELLIPLTLFGLLFGYGWFGVDYEDEILVKDAIEYPWNRSYVYGPLAEKELAVDYWPKINTQVWAFYLFCTEFDTDRPEARLNVYGVFEIFIDGEWKMIACGQKGDHLLIGCEMKDLKLIPEELRRRMLIEMEKCLEGEFNPDVLRPNNISQSWW